MKRIIAPLKSSLFRWWVMITTVYSASSTCPCCGKQGCFIGMGCAAIFGLVFVSAGAFLAKMSKKIGVFLKERIGSAA